MYMYFIFYVVILSKMFRDYGIYIYVKINKIIFRCYCYCCFLKEFVCILEYC